MTFDIALAITDLLLLLLLGLQHLRINLISERLKLLEDFIDNVHKAIMEEVTKNGNED